MEEGNTNVNQNQTNNVERSNEGEAIQNENRRVIPQDTVNVQSNAVPAINNLTKAND